MVVDHTSQVEHCIHVCEIPPRRRASGWHLREGNLDSKAHCETESTERSQPRK